MESERSLSNQSFDVLIRLARTQGSELRMSELAAQTSLTPSGLTRSVDRLQDQGLVVRRVLPRGPAGCVRRADPGRPGIHGPCHTGHSPTSTRCSTDLFTPEEEETLAALLRRLRDYVLEANAGCPGTTHEVTDLPGRLRAPARAVRPGQRSDRAPARTRVSSRLPCSDWPGRAARHRIDPQPAGECGHPSCPGRPRR